MKSDVLVSLIKEVVKSEVKRQVKEEVIKLIKSGDISLNTNNKKPVSKTNSASPLKEMLNTTKKQTIAQPKQKVQTMREFSKDPLLNEILNSTTPFSSSERAGESIGGSVLDMIQPKISMEGEWETMDYREMGNVMPQQSLPIESTGDALQDATMKALTRDYRDLVKRF
jgi:hypothetical protein